MDRDSGHRPVLLEDAIEGLAVVPDGTYLDGTFGRGGHAGAILARLGEGGRLLATDKDVEAVEIARIRFGADPRFTATQGSFTSLIQIAEKEELNGRVNGILLDLGVSSPQLDDPGRGFSFTRDGPLDMRMDASRGSSAAQWLAEVSQEDLARVLRTYGEERFAKRIARRIVAARERQPITTTAQLAELIVAGVPRKARHKHPATRSFQAIRIFINKELDELSAFLDRVPALLAPNGRLAVISFHSLEDRIVKRFIKGQREQAPRRLPITGYAGSAPLRPIGKPVRAAAAECAANPRARSAVLRIAERVA